ncbi:TonB-dependent receptor [Porticoccus sp. W117]|uniref:TonB-dependent receptor domain-containing protein n=1 Tax=Porticoccus sp. W117 TaxID=3054777 RepID=UPI002598C709|nr:TonB-dependent receptor [Porticoccus sp. W117]MDM3869748.1 TonB-dependent receptor [Porticoccus sp. W117]
MKNSKATFKAKRLAVGISAALALTLACGAQASEKTISLEIKSQKIGSALMEFGERAGVQVILPQELGLSVNSRGINGDYSINSALDALLQGSGLTYEFVSNDSVLIKAAASKDEGSSDATELNEESFEQVVVTGSRIAQDQSLEAASPVMSIGSAEIKTSGQIDLGLLLREAPQLQSSQPASFSAFNGTPLGASLLDLRNLGAERTLVVENGRRHVSAIEGEASVDVNTISTALLRNVEVLTGGASAVYGADAVTGVVNFNMRKGSSFDGVEIRTQTGISADGDANEFFLSLANGFSSDRGDMVFAIEYQQASSIAAGDRDFAGSGIYSFVTNTAFDESDPNSARNIWLQDVRLPISSGAGIISLSGSAFDDVVFSDGVPGCDFPIGVSTLFPACQVVGSDGQLRLYNPGDVFLDGFNGSGGDGSTIAPDSELLLPESDRILFQTAGSYVVNDYVNFFGDAKLVFSKTSESDQVNGFNDNIPIALDNPFIPDELRSQLDTLQAEGAVPDVDFALVMSRDMLDETVRPEPVAERSTFRLVVGVDGSIPNTDISYEVAYNYGRTDSDITVRSRLEDRFFAAIDAVRDPASGEIVCRSELDPTAVPPTSSFPAVNDNFGFNTFVPGQGNCVPVNLFGANSVSQAAADWIYQPETAQNQIEQENILAVMSGTTTDLFELPAGPVGFALGYEWRRESSQFTPSGFSALGVTSSTQDSQGGATLPSNGEYDVSEFFVEAQLPLLTGKRFAERLELRTAYRASDYEPYGDTDAWTLGGVWSPIEELTFRTTLSEAVRVPNIGEAFSPRTLDTIEAFQDPCNQAFIRAGSDFREANCIALIGDSVADGTYNSSDFLSAFVAGSASGNPNLDPEEAETLTVGAVWNPTDGLFNGLVVTLDYYNIEIDNLITTLSGFEVAQNCVDAVDINNPFCAAVQRDATDGFITNFQTGFINFSSVESSGVDFRLDYGLDVANGYLDLTVNGTRFIKHEEARDQSQPDEVTDVLGIFGRPELIVNMNADYAIGDFVIGWSGRFEDEQLLPGIENQDIANDPRFVSISSAGSSLVHDFSLSYDFNNTIQVFGGVNNAFAKDPHFASLSRPAGPRGRFFFLGVNMSI